MARVMNWATAAATLNISRDRAEAITLQGLSASYRKAMSGNHPDQGGAIDEAVRINAARDVLRDWIKAGKPVDVPPAKTPPQATPAAPIHAKSDDEWRRVRIVALAAVMLIVACVVWIVLTRDPAPSVQPTVNQTVETPHEKSYEEIEREMHKPNTCLYDAYGRCYKKVFDAWKGNP